MSRISLVPFLGLQLAVLTILITGVFFPSGRAAAMGYERVVTGPCALQGCILATGTFGAGSAEDFAVLLKEWRTAPGTLVLLDSDGGDVVSALKLGGVIRRAGLSTMVGAHRPGDAAFKPATCASACTYAFLGGATRSLVQGSRIGVHQVFDEGLSAADAQWLNALIAVHVNKMGASFGLLTLAMSTPPPRMRWLTGKEVAALQVTTAGEGGEVRDPGAAAALNRVEAEIGRQSPSLRTALGLGR